MITRLPSNSKPYDLVWSGDAAFVQLATDATPEQRKAHIHAWKVARETGDYSALAVEGAAPPTIFTMRQLTHDQTAALIDLSRQLGVAEVNSLAFFAALEAATDFEVKRNVLHSRLGLIASSSLFADQGVPPAMSVNITLELGEIVFEKMASLGK